MDEDFIERAENFLLYWDKFKNDYASLHNALDLFQLLTELSKFYGAGTPNYNKIFPLRSVVANKIVDLIDGEVGLVE